jgi:hypothetical protein
VRVRIISFCLCFLLLITLIPYGRGQSKNPSAHLDYFYIVATVVSDAAPFWYRYILDATPTNGGTTVRYVRIAPLDFLCGDITVKAIETKMTGATPAKLVGSNDPCALAMETARQSIKKPKVMESIFESIKFSVVASCGGEQRVFELPFREEVDFKGLKREAPRVAALWDLYGQVRAKAFGKNSIFYEITEARDIELQQFGDSLVPELLTGKYDMGFSEFCGRPPLLRNPDCDPNPTKTLLHGFRPGLKVPDRTPQLENPEQYHFIRYVAPVYPMIAQRARIESKINLEVVIDKDTGKTLKADVLTGHPLLNQSAIGAALQWQFDLSLQKPNQPIIRLVMIYSLACR